MWIEFVYLYYDYRSTQKLCFDKIQPIKLLYFDRQVVYDYNP